MAFAAALLHRTRAASAIRVLIVDDSVVARAALSRMLADTQAFEVVAALDGARRAIDWLATSSVDIVLLDIQMPGLDGIAALPELIAASSGARIVIVSAMAGDGARATVQALALGAADTLAKPDTGLLGRQFGDVLIERMLRLGKARPAISVEICEPRVLNEVNENPVACLAVGASTGGLHALGAFFAALPPSFDAPILVTQHLPPAFIPFFADQLAALSGRITRVATGGDVVDQGELLIAPGHAHLSVHRVGSSVVSALLQRSTASRCCPSVDPMFSSVAETYGERAVGVVLTGMGRDGCVGGVSIVEAGGTIIAQDAASATVWGMPGSVVRAGLASLVAPPAALAAYVANRGPTS
jgi:two-component system, chemotaxis family, protein-glutamate methylesterase/glutaminase